MADFSGKWKIFQKNSKELHQILRCSGYGRIASKYISSKNLIVNVSHYTNSEMEEELSLTIKVPFNKIVKIYPLKNFTREMIDINGKHYIEHIEYCKDDKKLQIKTIYLENSINITEIWNLRDSNTCSQQITVLHPKYNELKTLVQYHKI